MDITSLKLTETMKETLLGMVKEDRHTVRKYGENAFRKMAPSPHDGFARPLVKRGLLEPHQEGSYTLYTITELGFQVADAIEKE
jgi:hypothetical protein